MSTEIITLIKYKCDCCRFEQTFQTFETPIGWHTEREDHTDSYCPKCHYAGRQLSNKCPCGNIINN